MRRILYLYILVATLLVSCQKGDDYTSPRANLAECEQVTIMYFMGTDLRSTYLYHNIPDVKSAIAGGALGSNGRLFVFIPGYSDAELYELYEKDGVCYSDPIVTYGSNESLSEERMTMVLNKVKSFASAKTYNIVFSGHGTGWVFKNWTDLASVRSSVGSGSTSWQLSFEQEQEGLTRYMGVSTDGYMDITELRSALDATSTTYGYLLFDMCLMSNIETLYELKDVCENVIASPSEVMGNGFPYQVVLPELFEDDGATADLNGACYAYYNAYKSSSSSPYATVAHCVTSYLDDLANVVRSINEAGVEDVDIDDVQCYEKLTNNIFCDLGDYISQACTDSDLLAEFESVMSSAFPEESRYHTDYFFTNLKNHAGDVYVYSDKYWGVSTSDPSDVLRTDWAQTSWAVATTAGE
ncbi:MAG: clostripain-related cysteine peptidase [Rikenellaceae bacterium]